MSDLIIGQKFGRLTVIKKTNKKQRRETLYACKCNCGEITYQVANALKNGHAKSCGCLQRELASDVVKKKIVNGTKPDAFKDGAMMKTNTTGFRGVTSYKQSGKTKYMAYLGVQGKRYSKKGFKTPEEAYEYRLELEEKYLKPVLEEIEQQINL